MLQDTLALGVFGARLRQVSAAPPPFARLRTPNFENRGHHEKHQRDVDVLRAGEIPQQWAPAPECSRRVGLSPC